MMVAAKLVEIKAGLSNLVDNKLVADPRKGRIEVIRVGIGGVCLMAAEQGTSFRILLLMGARVHAGPGWAGAFYMVREGGH